MTEKQLKILIVDDEPEVTRSIAAYLERIGYEPRGLNDSDQFMDTFLEFKPDLIILDIIMPKVDGVELCRSVRRRCRCTARSSC